MHIDQNKEYATFKVKERKERKEKWRYKKDIFRS